MAVANNVETLISDNKVTIFSKSYCPYCKRAKTLFKNEYPDVETKIVELDEISEGSDIQDYLAEKTGQRSVPNIFVNQKHVGGCDTVVSLQSQGKLNPLIHGY